ncbi:MAG TPA: PilZ domain-containing protein [Allosphingosinicella sp.]|nr:PilZ domain-containing protein [Allosphingosinicella sp.]
MLVGSAAVALQAPELVIEQRSEPRYEDVVDRAVITFRDRDHPVRVLNISSRGTMIESDIVPRMGESLLVRFENCSRIHGFVRWAHDGQLGIRFGHEIILAS